MRSGRISTGENYRLRDEREKTERRKRSMARVLRILYCALAISSLGTMYLVCREIYSSRAELLMFFQKVIVAMIQLVQDHPTSTMFMVTLILI